MSTKEKKKNNNFYIYADIILFIVLILIIYILFVPGSSNNEDVNGNSSNDTNSKPMEDIKVSNNYDFYKEENKDRYEKYKESHKDLDDEKVIIYVNIGLDKEAYKDIKDSPNKHKNTVIVNKYYYLGNDYEPSNLTKISNWYASTDSKYLEKEAAVAFEKMAKAADRQGYSLVAVSAYRSFSYQENLYNNYVKKDGVEKADRYSARPGYSEHQTGLAVDISNGKTSYTEFGNTKEYNWMQENCYKYGFILRYTEENEFITGYMSEPWHYRYVGEEIATYIHNNPMTYEEYYVRFLDK